VHIADVAHFLPSRRWMWARQRATSVYLPDRIIPMLPEIISNNLASLQPDRVRTKSVSIEPTATGRVHTETFASAIPEQAAVHLRRGR
jgi:ribonuclease R